MSDKSKSDGAIHCYQHYNFFFFLKQLVFGSYSKVDLLFLTMLKKVNSKGNRTVNLKLDFKKQINTLFLMHQVA